MLHSWFVALESVNSSTTSWNLPVTFSFFVALKVSFITCPSAFMFPVDIKANLTFPLVEVETLVNEFFKIPSENDASCISNISLSYSR